MLMGRRFGLVNREPTEHWAPSKAPGSISTTDQTGHSGTLVLSQHEKWKLEDQKFIFSYLASSRPAQDT